MPIDRNDLPNHLFGIPDLDLSGDLCAESLAGPWPRKVADITSGELARLLPVSPASRNLEIRHLKSIFSYGKSAVG